MSQRDAEKVEMMKDIPRKEEFQKYLEKAGVIDQLTKLLVSLYENPDRPENALDYIKQFLGANHGQNANVESIHYDNPFPLFLQSDSNRKFAMEITMDHIP